jgi:beta-xylosidase
MITDTFSNPVLFEDIPDPDVIRAGDRYVLVCTTFHYSPGHTLMESRDLVNWSHLGHAAARREPAEFFRAPKPGLGLWAPALRHHAGRWLLYSCHPDAGLLLFAAERPEGPWRYEGVIKARAGAIDPCPYWAPDGTAWLAHAWAASRCGFNNVITLHRMAEDGSSLLDEGEIVLDGAKFGLSTLEGPKLYSRNGYTYVFAPTGGISHGEQSVFRARDPRGPYEHRVVMARGGTDVNGPHQGAWVETPGGESWFLHFQHRAPFGRVAHLQPMRWENDWPIVGEAEAGATCGRPVARARRPDGAAGPEQARGWRETFAGGVVGPRWQWQADAEADWAGRAAGGAGGLRLVAASEPETGAPALRRRVLTARLAGPACVVVAQIEPEAGGSGWLGLLDREGAAIEVAADREGARRVRRLGAERFEEASLPAGGPVTLGFALASDGVARFFVIEAKGGRREIGPGHRVVEPGLMGVRAGIGAVAGAVVVSGVEMSVGAEVAPCRANDA